MNLSASGFISGYAFKSEDFCEVGLPVVKIKNISDRLASTINSQCVPAELLTEKLKKFLLKNGDVLIAMTGQGSVGRVGRLQCSTHQRPLMNQRVGRFLANESSLNKDYLFYVISSEVFEKQLFALASGSGQPNLGPEAILSVEIPFPPYLIQVAIAETLNALDDRITLLRETNATLEAIAQTLFKSWFVDFDPVRAKLEGRTPEGMDEATAALFPDGFEESELGLVPRGWRFSTVGQSFVLTMGQSPPGDTYSTDDNGLPFYQGRTDFGFRFPTKRMYCSAPTRIAEIGDTLVSVRAPVGDVNMAIERCCVGRGVASVRHPEDYRSFTFYAMRGLGQRFENFDSEGTIFGSINKKDFQALPVIAPKLSVLAAYDEVASPIDARIVENEEQIRTLATLRDTLLPRLISGQLRLPEANLQIQGAAI